MDLPLGFIPPVGFRNGLVCASITCYSGHDGQVILLDDFFHHLYGLEISQHVSFQLGVNIIKVLQKHPTTDPTEQMTFASLICFETLNTSSISVKEPVAIGFSTNNATPGKHLIICISMSRPGSVVPRNMGGLPTMTARGRSRGDMTLTKSSRDLKTRVSW